jgi:hypothetical protein
MPGSTTTPGHMDTRAVVPIRVAFRQQNGVGARNEGLSRLDGWPVHSPTDASLAPSRVPAHGSGPMRFATPSSWRTFTAYSLPVSPAHSAVPPDSRHDSDGPEQLRFVPIPAVSVRNKVRAQDF